MNETYNTRLLRLYKLLWEQIKGKKDLSYGLCHFVLFLYLDESITDEEDEILKDDIKKNMPKIDGSNYGWPQAINYTADRKAFVQRMIKELSNGDN